MREALDRFWFAPAPAWPLAASRIAFYAAVLLLYGAEDFRFVVPLGEIHWRPTSFLHGLAPDGPPPAAVIGVMQWTWRVSLVAALLGLATPAATAAAALLGLPLLAFPYAASRVTHESAAMALGLVVLALARSGDALSLDRRLARRPRPAPSGEYRWPIATMRVVLSLVFLSAGLAKIGVSGLEWITTDHLALLLAAREQPLAGMIVESDLACHALAAATVGIEVLHPLALVSPVLAAVLVPAGLGLLGGILLLMGIPFWPLVATHVFWIPWHRFRRPGA